MSSPSNRAGYVLDSGVRRLAEGRILLGGQPPRLVRLSPSGASALAAALAGTAGAGPSGPSARLLEHLREAGIVHRSPEAPAELPQVTFVVPVHQPAPYLERLLGALAEPGIGQVVVVDDASEDGGAATARAASHYGATAVCRASRGGPGAARNTAEVASGFVVYLDADAAVDPDAPLDWVGRCLAHFDHPQLAVVAPRVRSLPGAGALASYEEANSPLDLGPQPGWVGSCRPLSYVPATALVCRSAALASVGGFDPALRFGEDVDLLRRLERAGWLVYYDPGAVVWHHPRAGLAGFCRQRRDYGTAAASLEARHPGTVAPYAGAIGSTTGAIVALGSLSGLLTRRRNLTRSSVALWSLATVLPVVGLSSKLSKVRARSAAALALSLVARAQAGSLRALLRALRRCWWPFLVPLLCSRRSRGVASWFLLAGQLERATGLRRQPDEEHRTSCLLARTVQHVSLAMADDLSYGTGVWLGCIRQRSFRALLPVLVRHGRAEKQSERGLGSAAGVAQHRKRGV